MSNFFFKSFSFILAIVGESFFRCRKGLFFRTCKKVSKVVVVVVAVAVVVPCDSC